MPDPQPLSEAEEALARLAAYATTQFPRGMDHDEVHSLHVGTEREVRLKRSDIRIALTTIANLRAVVSAAKGTVVAYDQFVSVYGRPRSPFARKMEDLRAALANVSSPASKD